MTRVQCYVTHHAGCACYEARRDAAIAEVTRERDEARAEVERLRADLGAGAALLRSVGRSRDTLDVVIDRARRVLAASPSAEGAAAALAILDSVRVVAQLPARRARPAPTEGT